MAKVSPRKANALREIICNLVCDEYGISRHSLMYGRTLGRDGHAFARQVAMYLLNVSGVSLLTTGILIGGRHRNTTVLACASIEDARDDREFDAKMDQLEAAVTAKVNGANA